MLAGSDRDGDTVTFHATGLPAGATLNPTTGRFEWQVGYDQAGVYPVLFTVCAVLPASFARCHAHGCEPECRSDFSLAERLARRRGGHSGLFRRRADLIIRTLPAPFNRRYRTLSTPQLVCRRARPSTARLARFVEHWLSVGRKVCCHLHRDDDGDGGGASDVAEVTTTIVVQNRNRRPVIAPVSNIAVSGTSSTDINFYAADADGNPLQLAAASALPGYPLPAFMSLTGSRQWPWAHSRHRAPALRGQYAVKVLATDNGDGAGPGSTLTGEFTFIVSVEVPNAPPVIVPPGDKVALLGQQLLTLTASDADQEALAFSLAGLPGRRYAHAGSWFNTANLLWIPTAAGVYDVAIQATDSGNSGATAPCRPSSTSASSCAVSNQPPTLTAPGNPSVVEGATLVFALAGLDPDSDPLTFTATDLPEDATLDRTTGVVH